MTAAIPASSLISPIGCFQADSIQEQVDSAIQDLLGSFPNPKLLSAEQRRGIIARYASVLEGNFIYWMTGAYIAARTEEARLIILDNLREEVRDCHPAMMRRFAVAANAAPSAEDAAAVYRDLSNVRLFVGGLCSPAIVLMMAFFEGLIQRFMPYLGELAQLQGSNELEYTNVHGVCDIAHTAGLFLAFQAEAALNPLESGIGLFEGVDLLCALLRTVIGEIGAPTDSRSSK